MVSNTVIYIAMLFVFADPYNGDVTTFERRHIEPTLQQCRTRGEGFVRLFNEAQARVEQAGGDMLAKGYYHCEVHHHG